MSNPVSQTVGRLSMSLSAGPKEVSKNSWCPRDKPPFLGQHVVPVVPWIPQMVQQKPTHFHMTNW